MDDEKPSGFAKAVLAACKWVHLRCLDTKAFLIGEARQLYDSTGGLLWWRDDTHFNEPGHKAVASFIVGEVLDNSSSSVK